MTEVETEMIVSSPQDIKFLTVEPTKEETENVYGCLFNNLLERKDSLSVGIIIHSIIEEDFLKSGGQFSVEDFDAAQKALIKVSTRIAKIYGPENELYDLRSANRLYEYLQDEKKRAINKRYSQMSDWF